MKINCGKQIMTGLIIPMLGFLFHKHYIRAKNYPIEKQLFLLGFNGWMTKYKHEHFILLFHLKSIFIYHEMYIQLTFEQREDKQIFIHEIPIESCFLLMENCESVGLHHYQKPLTDACHMILKYEIDKVLILPKELLQLCLHFLC